MKNKNALAIIFGVLYYLILAGLSFFTFGLNVVFDGVINLFSVVLFIVCIFVMPVLFIFLPIIFIKILN